MRRITSIKPLTCLKCEAPLYRSITGNIIDYRHVGGEAQCPKIITAGEPHISSLIDQEDYLPLAA